MKRIIPLLTVFASMWFAGSLPAWASCLNASLQGGYGSQRQGFNPAAGHVGNIGVITFDGNGNGVSFGERESQGQSSGRQG